MAFRRQNYPAAEVFYRTATETAPSRPASWLRLAWSQLAQQRFAAAAADLKTALHLRDDPTDSWISGSLLYGGNFPAHATHQNQQLWNWLQERPSSTDRLLLTAAYQHLREDHATAQELLTVAVQNGLPDTLQRAMQQIGNDIHRKAERYHQPPSTTQPSTTQPSTNANTQNIYSPSHAPDAARIPPQQGRTVPATPDVLILPDVGSPEAIDANDFDSPGIPPIPKDPTSARESSQSQPANLSNRSRQTPVSA